MTADDARDRVTVMRDGLRRAMRHLSKPRPDWGAASADLLIVEEAAHELFMDCREELQKGQVAYGIGYHIEKIAEGIQDALVAFGVWGQEIEEVDHGDR